MIGIGRLEHHPGELAYLRETSATGPPRRPAPQWRTDLDRVHGECESAVNEIIAKRMNKRPQMRWNGATVQLFLEVLTAVLNYTLEDAFRRRYPPLPPHKRR